MPAENGQPHSGGNSGAGSGFLLRLRLSSFLTLAFLFVAAVSLAYIAGVMSGRHTVSVTESGGLSQASERGARLGKDGEAGQTEKAGSRILSAEELEFARVLRQDGKSAPPGNKAPLTAAETQAAAEPAPAPKKEVAEERPEEKAAEKTVELPPVTPAGEQYDYIFQLGSFKDEKSVDNLRQSLEGYGLRTTMERNGKLLTVLVKLRGNEDRALEVRAIARQLRLGEPLLRSRKAVR